MFIDDSTIEEIKQRVDIVEVISSYVSLKSHGKTMKGLCPFHSEKTPSFVVNRDRQSYHCFGCSASGDVISFLREKEGLNFTDVIEKLALMAGIRLKKQNLNDPDALKRKNLYHITETALNFFMNNLLDKKTGESCLAYLSQRGISHETIEQFKIGVAVDSWDALLSHFKDKGFSNDLGVESGLIVLSEKNRKYFDKFRHRVVFPVFNASNQVVGFSGRTLESGNKETAKYMNSPETFIFKKSRLLYGMSLAKKHISKNDQAILAEGHLDVCMLHQYGFSNALGIQGTAFTDEHALWLSKYTKNLVVLFDGDNAGIKAAVKVLPLALKFGLTAKIVVLPATEDPASYLIKYGADKLNKLVEQAGSLFDYKINYLIGNRALSPEVKDSVAHLMLEDIMAVKNPVLADTLKQELATIIQVGLNSLSSELFNLSRRDNYLQNRKINSVAPSSLSLEDLLRTFTAPEKELLKLLISNGDSHYKIFKELDFEWISNPTLKRIVIAVFKLFCEKFFSVENISDVCQKQPVILELIQWSASYSYDNELDKAIKDTLLHLQVGYLIRERDKLISSLQNKDNLNVVNKDVMKQIDDIKKLIQKLLHPNIS